MARRSSAITADETTTALEQFEEAGMTARELSERMFKSLDDDFGNIEAALCTTLTAAADLSELARKLASRIRNEADRRQLEAKLRAEVKGAA